MFGIEANVFRRNGCILIACLTLACWTTGARAQGFDATTLRQPPNPEGGWLVHGGDDPAYARPEFDDSHRRR